MQARSSWHARARLGHRRGPREHRRGPGRALAATVVATALLVAGAGAAPAAQGRVDPGIEVAGVTGYGTVWLGAVEGTAEAQASGWLSWCISAGYDAPSGLPATAVGTVADPALAWVVQAHEHDGTALSRAAISYLAHVRHETGTTAVPAATRVAAFEAATPQAVKDTARAFLAEAASQAGPYSAATGGTQYTQARRTGVVVVHPLVSGDGTVLTGRAVRVTLVGPAVFDTDQDGVADAGEGTVWTGSTSDGDLRLPWVATGTGEVTWSYAYSGLPRRTLTRLTAAGQVQDSLTYGLRAPSDPEEITVPGEPFPVVPDFQPEATSDVVGSKVVDPGQQLTDTLTVRAAAGDEWVTLGGDPVDVLLEGTAYGTGLVPVDEGSSVPPDTPVVATATVLADGPGRYTATAQAPATGQVVTWVWRVVKEHQPAASRDLVRGDWSDGFGLPAETTSVRHDTVEVDSTLRVQETRSGAYLVDDLWVTGFTDGHPTFVGAAGIGADTTTMAQELWFFPAGAPVTDEHLDAAELVASVRVPARDGYQPSVGSTRFRVRVAADGSRVPGTYVFRTVFAGDHRVVPFTTSVEDVTEQLTVAPEPLAVTTRVRTDRPLVAGGDATVHDVATVTGAVPDGATIEFALYRWTGEEAVCTEETLVARTSAAALDGSGAGADPDPGTAEATAPGDHLSPPTTLTDVGSGSYGYVETLRDTEGHVLARGGCGVTAETLDVLTVTTRARTADPLVQGGSAELWDVATVSGPVPEGATLEFDLYRWVGDEPACTAETRAAHLDPVDLSDAGEHRSATTVVPVVGAGRYGYVETVRDDSGAVLHRGTCGVADETVTVLPASAAPTATPSASATPAEVSGPLAVTGTQAALAGGAAGGLLLAGAVLVLLRRQGQRTGTTGEEGVTGG